MSEKLTEKNSYTIGFTVVMVLIVATLLTVVSLSLKPRQEVNKQNEKMQNILQSVGVDVERDQAKPLYDKYIKESLVLDDDGNPIEGEDAFTVDTQKDKDKHPVFIADKEGEKFIIIPVNGVGLWDAIWGYVAFNKDKNIEGVVFDHRGETPGLGAEITQDYFQDLFTGEYVFKSDGEVQGIVVKKGYTDTDNKEDGTVNAISGATITSQGVGDMITNSIQPYVKYIKNN